MPSPMELPAAEARVRAAGPAGVPAVGEPPVPVRTVLRALERAAGTEEAKLAAVAAALGLAQDDVLAARTVAELKPAALDVRPPPMTLLSLTVPVALGAWLVGPALLGVAWVLCALPMLQAKEAPPGTGLQVAVTLALLGLATLPGVGLARVQRWGRAAALAIGGLAFAAGQAGLAGPGASAWGAVVLLGALALLLGPFDRWFQPAAGAGGLSTRPVAAAAAGIAAGVVGLLGPVRRFKEIFASMGVQLPLLTQWALDAGDLLEAWWPALLPLLFLLPAPLLLVPRRREPLAFWVTATALILANWLLVVVVWLPIKALQDALGP